MSSPKLNIAIIEPVGGHGGMEFYDYGLAQGLAQNEVNVTLYTCNETVVRQYTNVTTTKHFGNTWGKQKIPKLLSFLRGYRRSFSECKQNNVDVVHLHFFQIGWLNLMVLRMARRYPFKKVITLHDVDPLVNNASSRIHRYTYALVDHVIVHNNFSKKELTKKDIEPEKITIVAHGNYLPFVKTIENDSFNNSDQFNLLFFGQIKEMKGLDVLIEAIAIANKTNPNIYLTIAGRPWHTNAEKYHEMVLQLGLSEQISEHYNYIPNEEVINYFEACDLVVLPYKRIYQSGVLLLSMSYGKPCLTSDLEPFSDIIDDGVNGYLFRSESAQDLSKRILEIAADKTKLLGISANASVILQEKYDWKVIGEQTKIVYNNLLNQNN